MTRLNVILSIKKFKTKSFRNLVKLKRSGKFENSPDVCNYPFVAGFATKDMARQQEFHLKKSRGLASKKYIEYLKKKSQLLS